MAVALLYPSGIAISTLTALVRGFAEPPADTVAFPEGGGSTDLELAIPRMPGMDEVVVDVGRLRVVAQPSEQDLSVFQVVDAPGGGSILDLGAESRLRRVVVDAPAATTAALPNLRTVVRAAPGRVPGPPLFANPPFDGPPMFGKVLAGLTVATVAEGRQLSLPGAPGSAWLLQYATGTEATNLVSLADRLAVRRVVVDAAATDVTLVIRGATEEDPGVPLWHHPGAFLPESGVQEINFTALAQKQLAAALTSDTVPHTLPIPLRLASATGGAVRVVEKTLVARYLARPLGPGPVTARIGGEWTTLSLSAPAHRRPERSTLRVTARHLGRELNGTQLPPLEVPRAGVRVADRRLVAAAATVEAGPVPLVGVRVMVSAADGTETVLELRTDAAGAPGALLAPPVVRQIPAAAEPSWREFGLPAPVPAAGPVWVTMRVNRGALHWRTAPAGSGGDARASVDGGVSWGAVDTTLAGTGGPLVQLFHAAPAPPELPVDLYLADRPAGTVTLTAVPGGAGEFAAETALPAPVLSALTAAAGADRAVTPLTLFSRAVADLTVAELTLAYDPYAQPGG